MWITGVRYYIQLILKRCTLLVRKIYRKMYLIDIPFPKTRFFRITSKLLRFSPLEYYQLLFDQCQVAEAGKVENYVSQKLNIPWRFRKAGRVWYDGARETREPHVTIVRTVSKKEATKNIPGFQDLSGRISKKKVGLMCNYTIKSYENQNLYLILFWKNV